MLVIKAKGKVLRVAILCFVAAGVVIISSCGEKLNIENELNSLVAAERDFARTSAEKGIRDAFLAFLDSESLVFRPDPVNGIEATEKSKPSEASLQWAPLYADISASGDLGYTTGPWEYRPGGIDDSTVIYGNYISIWKKQADGGWKVILDTGISNPAPDVALADIQTETGFKFKTPESQSEDLKREIQDLIEFDRRGSVFCDSNGTIEFYDKYCVDDIRFFRDKIMPVIGKNRVIDYLGENPGRFTWNPFDAYISKHADFGYSYGLARFEPESEGNAETQYGYYMRIWRRSEKGIWKIALEVISPGPPPEDDKS